MGRRFRYEGSKLDRIPYICVDLEVKLSSSLCWGPSVGRVHYVGVYTNNEQTKFCENLKKNYLPPYRDIRRMPRPLETIEVTNKGSLSAFFSGLSSQTVDSKALTYLCSG